MLTYIDHKTVDKMARAWGQEGEEKDTSGVREVGDGSTGVRIGSRRMDKELWM